MFWKMLSILTRLFIQILESRMLNSLLGLIGFLLGVLSVVLAYWGVRLTKRSEEAILNTLHCKAYVVKIKKKHYLFAQVVLRNVGRAWVKLLPLMHMQLMITVGKWWQYFELGEYHFKQDVWRVASSKFDFAIDFSHINQNPEIMLYPDGLCLVFYFTGECSQFMIPREQLSQGAIVKIPYAYETEKGRLKFRSSLLLKHVLIGGEIERKTPAFAVEIPIVFEIT